ncbi:hypothetical protein [uncultured Litoreibacter sp.]|uniref:hypothetical protein n=1 Tax=uncultured Litoreibacter sp. TaxID=1392394 RepID=UPI00261856ED|nr:hypothetical protein [uncultured Litoreibacter sp.]
MEYERLKPLKGVSAAEPTAFTKKTIKELLAEEGAEGSEAELMRSAAPQANPQPAPMPEPAIQRPAHAAPAAAQPAPADVAADALLGDATAKKPRSFLRRLIGG